MEIDLYELIKDRVFDAKLRVYARHWGDPRVQAALEQCENPETCGVSGEPISEKTAAMRLFLLQSMIRDLQDEWGAQSKAAKSPGTIKWYRYFSNELEIMMQKFRKKMPTFKEPSP